MTFAIPGLGKILASHAASGVSVGSTATQTLAHLTKGVHATASQAANQPKFAEILNKTRISSEAQTILSPGKS
jgi:NADPH:quinone reductase-like Zn-dependent oxidoreductase